MSGFSKVKVRLDKIAASRIGCSTTSGGATATEWPGCVPPHVTEKILNHRGAHVAGPMGKIYQRYDFLKERREALELWAATLMRIVTRPVRRAA